MGMEILSNIGTAYKDVPKEMPKVENKDVTQNFENSNATQQIVESETKATTASDTTGRDKDYKDKDKDYDDEEKMSNLTLEQQERVKGAVNVANKKLKSLHTNCEFKYHEETKRITIKVKNEETGEVIREIPPEETLDMIGKMWDLVGLFVDDKG